MKSGELQLTIAGMLIGLGTFGPRLSAKQPHPEEPPIFDILIKNGHILDGSGNPWYADVGIRGDRIEAIGKLTNLRATTVIDASGQIVAPGFIDVLGQSEMSLRIDNRAPQQTLSGNHFGNHRRRQFHRPPNDKTITALKPFLDHYHLTFDWTTLDGYFQRLEKQGSPLNLGTFVGAAQVREAVIGEDDRVLTAAELDQMKVIDNPRELLGSCTRLESIPDSLLKKWAAAQADFPL